MSGLLVLLMVATELLAVFSVSLVKIIDSKALIADGWHHRTDAITTGMVILGLAGRNIGLPWLDGLAGLLVALFIVFTGIKMAYQAVSPLLGETAEKGEIEKIKEIGRQVPGVESVHDIRVQRYGNFNIVSIHVELSDRLSPHKMHEITVQIETRILRQFPGECVVHTDPVDLHHPLFNKVTDTMREVVIAHSDLLDFHDLKLWEENGAERGDVEVTVDHQVPKDTYQQMSSYILREINRCFPELKFQVFLKVDFSSTPINDHS